MGLPSAHSFPRISFNSDDRASHVSPLCFWLPSYWVSQNYLPRPNRRIDPPCLRFRYSSIVERFTPDDYNLRWSIASIVSEEKRAVGELIE